MEQRIKPRDRSLLPGLRRAFEWVPEAECVCRAARLTPIQERLSCRKARRAEKQAPSKDVARQVFILAARCRESTYAVDRHAPGRACRRRRNFFSSFSSTV